MSVRVTYSRGCHVALRRVHFKTARTVCEAVLAFARSGSGQIVEVNAHDGEPSGFVRIYGWGGFALVEVRADEIYVCGIFARPWVPRLVRPLLDDPWPPDNPE